MPNWRTPLKAYPLCRGRAVRLARFQLTEDEFRAFSGMPPRAISGATASLSRRIALGIVSAGAIVLALYFDRLILAVVLGVFFAGLAYLLISWAPAQERRGFEHNSFASGPISLLVESKFCRAESGLNVLQLSYSELLTFIESRSHFELNHRSGARLLVPKASLSSGELAHLQSIHERFPHVRCAQFS